MLSVVLGTAGVAALGVTASATTTAPASVAVVSPEDPVVHSGRWMIDGTGRVVIIHGVNMPSKNLPAYPAALGFDDDDAALLASSGLNAVRLTVERYAVEPAPRNFDDTYVAHIKDTIALLARHGILSLIDFHQDEYGPAFNDNGFPKWMTMTDGFPNVTQVGFPAQYFANPALNRAFDHFWANDVGPSGRRLQDDDADILAHVAGSLATQPGLLGYEIMNEPWPGNQYPTCVVPTLGCPVFDRGLYSAYYARVIPAIRAADPSHMIWYEPLSTFNQGVPTSVMPPSDPLLGFAFHDYPLCSAAANAASPSAAHPQCSLADRSETSTVLSNARAHSATTGNGLLETEFGATMDTAALAGQLDQYDQEMIPWMFWSYTRYIVALSSDGTLKPAAAPNLNQAMLATLARPYPQLVAGTPIGWGFDAHTKVFSLQYSADRADGQGTFPPNSETDITVPALQYPNGYRTTVSGATVVSPPDAPVLRVRATSGPGPIRVQVAPAAAGAQVNSSCPSGATPLVGGTSVSHAGTPTSGGGRLTICTTGTGVLDGTVTASGNAFDRQGYVVSDGQPHDPGPLAGYLGVDTQHGLTVVGCGGGDYNPDAPDDWNQSPTSKNNNAIAEAGGSTLTAPSGPVGPSSPCSPPLLATPSPGKKCGSAQDASPGWTLPGGSSPLNAYSSGSGPTAPSQSSDFGVAGDFGGNEGASGYFQVSHNTAGTGPTANVTTGGTSKGGGGTVAAGNDHNETADAITPAGTPVAVCQN